MIDTSELVIGDVLIAPFVAYALAAGIVLVSLRPLVRVLHLETLFASPPAALLGFYVLILAVLMASS